MSGHKCERCGCYCPAARDAAGMMLCPNYYPLRDALFPAGNPETLPEAEDRVLSWLAGMCDQSSRAALISLIGRAHAVARAEAAAKHPQCGRCGGESRPGKVTTHVYECTSCGAVFRRRTETEIG